MPELDGFIDLTEVDARLADVATRAKRAAPAFRELRVPLRSDQRDHAKAQAGPDGSWAPLSPLTVAKRKAHAKNVRANAKRLHPRNHRGRRRHSTKILGRLPTALVVTVGDLFVKATSRLDWSSAQNDGDIVGHGAKIPARVFLWLSERLVETAREVLLEHVLKGWEP